MKIEDITYIHKCEQHVNTALVLRVSRFVLPFASKDDLQIFQKHVDEVREDLDLSLIFRQRPDVITIL